MTIDPQPSEPLRHRDPPAINVPFVVLATIAVLAFVHLLRTQVLSETQDIWTLINLSMIPDCYRSNDEVCVLREPWANAVSPLSHAFLHGDWTHFLTNAVWLLAFGTPVARRIGAGRFLIFCALGATAGALLFDLLNPALLQPMIGASGVVSALMGAAARFALSGGAQRWGEPAYVPRLTLRESLTDRTVLFFIVIFFVTNVALGSGAAFLLGEGGAIAWEAHVGGFLFGLLAFDLFDRAPRPDLWDREERGLRP
ncbi:rhomboid family intramembrane serine protease [Aureimonas jatrophae]|uniref:Membrane associated serine protease, rhomboid family n=1 Tax=Aureimonas jatrophae TaxID=1166073 RepID=A0A1H0JMX3_9HYPH|nr:rhomboid family intramembrane serine protease [Aureimonas jatrophae]MBB3951331.1 membrane associated rhomboid family serine protease [Aureimonas jatrophae]SDO44882.1 Membrane associated serine protease, rhomboid family [Aureimonas jatrophae]